MPAGYAEGRNIVFDSLAPAHLKLVRDRSPLAATLAALPSMSLFPKAPFCLSASAFAKPSQLRRAKCPSMSLD